MNQALSKDPTPLPFEPEPIEALRARFLAALDPEWDVADLVARLTAEMPVNLDRPLLHRRHVLDCEDGLRLGVSRERHGDCRYIHVSASYCERTEPVYAHQLLNDVTERLRALGLFEAPGLSGARIVHVTAHVMHLTFPLRDGTGGSTCQP